LEKNVWSPTPLSVHDKKHCKGVALEIGCGIGRVLKHLPDGSVGIDHNKRSVDYCNSHGLSAQTTEEFDSSQLINNKVFDDIIFAHVLEHMNIFDSTQLVRKYVKFLKHDGRIIIITPQQMGFRSDPTHKQYLDFSGIKKIIEDNGFHVNLNKSFPFPRVFGKIFKYNEFFTVSTNSPLG